MGITARVLDGIAASSEKSKRFREKLETHFEDAGLQEDKSKGEMQFFFSEGMVVFRERTVEAENPDALVEKITELEELDEKELLGGLAKDMSKERFAYRIIIADGALMPLVADKMFIAKVLFKETGSLGAAELGMLDKAVLDFGENQWVISPVGVMLVGEIEDPTRCIYLIAQTMVGVASYSAIAEDLKKKLYETPPVFTEDELSKYEGDMERTSDTTSYVINDVRDEMLNADPRTVLIIKRLHEVMSIEGHEQRVRLFLDVAKRKVDRARATKASREAKRLAAILFAFSAIIAGSNIIAIFANITNDLKQSLIVALAVELPLVIVIVALVVYLFKEIFQKTLKF